jgi:hypothetical protein
VGRLRKRRRLLEMPESEQVKMLIAALAGFVVLGVWLALVGTIMGDDQA